VVTDSKIEYILIVIVFFISRIACNCHPDGSVHQNCTSQGVCECKPGVLGIKCDQCPENKYNLSVGCIGKFCFVC